MGIFVNKLDAANDGGLIYGDDLYVEFFYINISS